MAHGSRMAGVPAGRCPGAAAPSTHPTHLPTHRPSPQPSLSHEPWTINQSPGPPIVQCLFFSISNHCYPTISLCFYVFKVPRCPTQNSFSHQKIVWFSSLFSRVNKSEKRFLRLPQNDKNALHNSLKTFSWKVDLCNTFHAKTTIWKFQTSKFLIRNR